MKQPQHHRIRLIGNACLGTLLVGVALWMAPQAQAGTVYDTSQTYLFTNSNTSLSAADVATNPYGAAPATITLGPFAAGWQDPTKLFQLSSYDGAWDLGSNGTIQATVPFTSLSLASGIHEVNVLVDMTAFWDGGIFVAPTLTFSGTVLQPGTTTTTLDHLDPPFGQWNHTIRSNVVVQVTDTNTVVVTITSAPNGGVVDALSIHTQVIPEPTTIALVGAALVFFLGGRSPSRLFRRSNNP